MRLELWQTSFFVFPLLILLHLWVAPYTKVEESFNIQAIHDFLTFGLPLRNAGTKIEALYDHVVFAGAVPRTFIGAMTIAGISNPFVQLFSFDFHAQQMLGEYDQLVWRQALTLYSTRRAGHALCCSIVVLCGRRPPCLRQDHRRLVRSSTSQPVSHHVLCYADITKHVCVRAQWELSDP